MDNLPITLATASVLGLMLIWLSMKVINQRVKTETLIGESDDTDLLFLIRAHGNFIEYTPLFLIILGLVEMNGANQTAVVVIAAVFVIARVLHMLGMGQTANLKLRQAGMMGTFTCLAAASIYGIFLALT